MNQLDQLLDLRAIVQATTLSRSTIDRMETRGEFPTRVRITPYRVGWRASDIAEWLKDRVAGKGVGPTAEVHAAARAARAKKHRDHHHKTRST
jgi:prophage regulatory protein